MRYAAAAAYIAPDADATPLLFFFFFHYLDRRLSMFHAVIILIIARRYYFYAMLLRDVYFARGVYFVLLSAFSCHA